jgi:hypothetical protein
VQKKVPGATSCASGAYAPAADPRVLVLIDGDDHVDLYDQADAIL